MEVRDSGSKSGYQSVRKTLGRYGDITLEQARKLLAGYDDRVKGFVPGARLQIKRGDVGDGGASVTLDEMIEAYFAEKRNRDGKPLKPATVKGYSHILRYHFESWFPMTLAEIVKKPGP